MGSGEELRAMVNEACISCLGVQPGRSLAPRRQAIDRLKCLCMEGRAAKGVERRKTRAR